MHYNDIIISPVITEKAANVSSECKTYVFKFNKDANKFQTKNAIEEAYGVKVKRLNTKAKKRRVGRYTGYTKTYKKAYVTLKDGDTIEL